MSTKSANNLENVSRAVEITTMDEVYLFRRPAEREKNYIRIGISIVFQHLKNYLVKEREITYNTDVGL